MPDSKIDRTLRGFLVAAHENETECLIRYSELMGLLEQMATALRDMGGFNHGSPVEGLAPFEGALLLNAYSLYLSAVRIALSGQSPPVFAVLRACLESALYAVIAARSAKNRQIWAERHQNRKDCRNLFHKATAKKYLEEVDPMLATFVSELYDSLIEFGAHPNSISVFNHLSLHSRNEGEALTLAILHNVESDSIFQALAACLETGVSILYLGHHALPDYAPARAAHSVSTNLHRAFQEVVGQPIPES